jgi:hypothetical protein
VLLDVCVYLHVCMYVFMCTASVKASLLPAYKNGIFHLAELLQNDSTALQVDVTTVAQVPRDACSCDALLVDADHLRDGALVDVE